MGEIKDYIGDVEADSAASESPASQGREDRRREAGEACSDSDQEEVSPSPFSVSPDCEHPPSPRTLSPIPIPSSPTLSQNSPSPSPRELVSTSPRVSDLSVKSVLLSEFSSSDKIRYIERTSGMKASKSAMVLNRQEFCINI